MLPSYQQRHVKGGNKSYDSLTYSESNTETDSEYTGSTDMLSSMQGRVSSFPASGRSAATVCAPRVRNLLVTISLGLAVSAILLVASGLMESDEFLQAWELGFEGSRAQNTASASLIHALPVPKKKRKKKGRNDHDMGPSEGCESTIMIVRHCEKGSLKAHCNYHGFERAAYLATLFGDDEERWPAPDEIYALGTGRKHHKQNYREVETVDWVADKLHLEINDSYKTSHDKKLAQSLLESVVEGDKCGKLTLISWKHSDIPHLARLLGCGPMQGCPLDYKGKEFDQVWQIKYVYRRFRMGSQSKLARQQWDIFASIQYEDYDPLRFSKQVGDYPPGGTDHGGRWAKKDKHKEEFVFYGA